MQHVGEGGERDEQQVTDAAEVASDPYGSDLGKPKAI